MFISVSDLFKIGVGPSSSHTIGPMVAANNFRQRVEDFLAVSTTDKNVKVRFRLKGSLAFTGEGHATDSAVILGIHGYLPEELIDEDVAALASEKRQESMLSGLAQPVRFLPEHDLQFDFGQALPEHPNGLIAQLLTDEQHPEVLLEETYFSIGGGFIKTRQELLDDVQAVNADDGDSCPFPFASASAMLEMANAQGLSIAEMKRINEVSRIGERQTQKKLQHIWRAMRDCVENGLQGEGLLPGKLKVKKRAKDLFNGFQKDPQFVEVNDWLSAYAMAVNEENASGNMVVTAPTNGAAGVVPAVLYYLYKHRQITGSQIETFLLTAAAIGSIIKHCSSISGAEVGCQGEVGSAASMAAAGMCAALGGTPEQIENAAEIALEHHLGMTCDPVAGLVQVPCIERNGFGAMKAYMAAALALRGDGQHMMPLDSCIAAMKQTGLEMSEKYKETSLGGLAVKWVEC